MGYYTVKQGEDLKSILSKSEFGKIRIKKVINAPENLDLFGETLSRSANVLYPGDKVFIPAYSPKQLQASTDMRHKYRLKVSRHLVLYLKNENDEPIAQQSYILDLGNKIYSEKSGDDGKIEHYIPINSETVKLKINDEEYELIVAALDPVTTVTGVQARLVNMGFDAGAVDGVYGPRTKAAVIAFQAKMGLTEDGIVGKKTQDNLIEQHGS